MDPTDTWNPHLRHRWRGASIDPFAIAVSPPWKESLKPKRDAAEILAELKRTGDDKRFPKLTAVVSSQVRAMICAMNHDVITAGLWALAGFDPALVHFAELREHLAKAEQGERSRVSLDRALSVYVEGQCHELVHAAEITTEAMHELFNQLTDAKTVTHHILDCTEDPLAIEIAGYAMRLGVLTAHGRAPWKRFAAVMADCHAQLQAA